MGVEIPDLWNNLIAEARSVENAVMPHLFLKMICLHSRWNIAAEVMRGLSLANPGNIVSFALDC